MRKAKEVLIALGFAAVLPLTPITAYASPPSISDSKIVDSAQTVQLVSNTPSYAMWATWIRGEITRDASNYHNYKNGQFVARAISKDIDLITIKTTFNSIRAASPSPLDRPASPEEKPALLPVKGEPGEHITIVSQTPMTYLSWSYAWTRGTEGGHDGWHLIASAFHDCEFISNRPAGVRCERG